MKGTIKNNPRKRAIIFLIASYIIEFLIIKIWDNAGNFIQNNPQIHIPTGLIIGVIIIFILLIMLFFLSLNIFIKSIREIMEEDKTKQRSKEQA